MWTYGFRVDPDNRQDRKSGESVSRKMTPEDIEKYGNVGIPYKKPSMAGVKTMMRKDNYMNAKINQERLLEICKDGFTANAYREAAKEFGVTPHTIQCYVSNNKLNKVQEVKEGKAAQKIKADTKVKTEDVKVTPNVEDELEILSKIKSIVDENKVIAEENKTLKNNIQKIKSTLEDILKSIA